MYIPKLTEGYYTFNYKDHWDPGLWLHNVVTLKLKERELSMRNRCRYQCWPRTE